MRTFVVVDGLEIKEMERCVGGLWSCNRVLRARTTRFAYQHANPAFSTSSALA